MTVEKPAGPVLHQPAWDEAVEALRGAVAARLAMAAVPLYGEPNHLGKALDYVHAATRLEEAITRVVRNVMAGGEPQP